MSLEESNEVEGFKKEDNEKVLSYSLYILWGISALIAVWMLAYPQVKMSLSEDLFLYTFKTTSYVGFSFLSLVIAVDFLLLSVTSFSKVRCKLLSVVSILILSFSGSFFVSYEDLFLEMSLGHIALNNYRRCDDGLEVGSRRNFHWIVATRKLSECGRLSGARYSILNKESRYELYKKSIDQLQNPPKYIPTPTIEVKPSIANKVEEKAPLEETPDAPAVAPETEDESSVEPKKPLPTFKVAHRFLYYGEGEVMISDFRYLPASVLKEIEKVTKNAPSKEYKKNDLTKYIPEILSAFKMPKYKGISYKGETKFKFTEASLIHSSEKGFCFNYPDTYISLVSKDLKSTIQGKEYVGRPETEFTVFPQNSRKITDKSIIKALHKKMSHSFNPKDPLAYHPEYYQVEEKVYALMTEIEMGVSYDVFDCTKDCIKADYEIGYPPCGS